MQQLVEAMMKSARGDDAGDAAHVGIYQDMADQTMTTSLVDSRRRSASPARSTRCMKRSAGVNGDGPRAS